MANRQSRGLVRRMIVTALFVLAAVGLLLQCSLEGSWDIIRRELTPAPWVLPDQTFRIRLRFDTAEFSEDLVDFPVLVVLDSSRVDYSEFTAGGANVRFVDRDTQGQLPHEIELWDASGKSYLWVKVPRISAGSEYDSIYMYYGDAGAADDQDPDALWSEYELVYHFSSASTSVVPNSAPSGPDGVSYENSTAKAPVLQDSLVGKGIRLDGDYPAAPVLKRYVDTDYHADLASWTVEALIKADAAPKINAAGGYANGPIMGGTVYNLGWDHNDGTTFLGAVQLRDATTNWQAAKLGTLTGGTWHYLVGIYDGNVPSVRAFNNAQLTATQSNLSGALTSVGTTDVFIGVESNRNNPIDGIVDEVRISDKVRSAEWIRAQYRSMTDSFVVFGEPESVE
ncbi:MAG: DUF2341 domain-containing protein [Spirochaetales bacterium]|nr:DUF2341 domain-containing protein [Spirochaetales bacterium]